MHAAHPVGVAAGEVVVGGDDVHAVAGQRVEVGRQGGDEGLALTGLHLGDVAEVQRGAAHQLHLVVELAQRAPRGLAHDGERLGQQVVERLAVGEAFLERVGQRAQLGVGEIDVVVLERLDVIGDGGQPTDLFLFAGAQNLGKNHAAMVRAATRHARWRHRSPPGRLWQAEQVGRFRGIELDDLELDGRAPAPAALAQHGRRRVYEICRQRRVAHLPAAARPVHARARTEFVDDLGHEGRGAGTGLGCAVVERPTGRVVGAAALRLGRASGDIGYWIAPDARGHGYAAEATRVLARLGHVPACTGSGCDCDVRNLASALHRAAGRVHLRGHRRAARRTTRVPGRRATSPASPGSRRTAGAPTSPAFPPLPGGRARATACWPCGSTRRGRRARPDRDRGRATRCAGLRRPRAGPGRGSPSGRPARGLTGWSGGAAQLTMVDVASGAFAGEVQPAPGRPAAVGGIGYGVHPRLPRPRLHRPGAAAARPVGVRRRATSPAWNSARRSTTSPRSAPQLPAASSRTASATARLRNPDGTLQPTRCGSR